MLAVLGELLLRRRPERARVLRELAAAIAAGAAGSAGSGAAGSAGSGASWVDAVVQRSAQAEVRLQLESLDRARVLARVQARGAEHLPLDGGVVMLSHVGHHALAGAWLAREGRQPLEVALRPSELQERLPGASRAGGWFRGIVERRDRVLGVERTDVTRWLGPAVKALASGRLVVWPGDAAFGIRTEVLPFLGRPWRFPTGAVRAAVLTGKPVVFVHVVRVAPGVNQIQISNQRYPPVGQSTRAAQSWVRETMQAFVASLEHVVLERPELYLWRMATMIDVYGG